MNESTQDISPYQDSYWHFLQELLVHIYYLEKFLEHYQRIQRVLATVLAITSSASIAGWAVWKTFDIVWACAIALSQIINATKHIFPFSIREKHLLEILPQLNKLLLECEREFYNVKEGVYSNKDIHERTINFKERKEALITSLNESRLPENQAFLDAAEEEAKEYLKNYYHIGEQ